MSDDTEGTMHWLYSGRDAELLRQICTYFDSVRELAQPLLVDGERAAVLPGGVKLYRRFKAQYGEQSDTWCLRRDGVSVAISDYGDMHAAICGVLSYAFRIEDARIEAERTAREAQEIEAKTVAVRFITRGTERGEHRAR